MKFPIKKFLSITLPIALGVFLIIYKYNEFSAAQIAEMKGYFQQADYLYIYLSLFIALFGYISRAYRWKYPLQHLGYNPSFWNKLFAVCIAYMVNLSVPRSGEISRAVVLKKYENIPFDQGFGTIVAERIVDLFIFAGFFFVALIFQINVVSDFLTKHIPVDQLLILAAVGIILAAIFMLVWIYSKLGIILKAKEKLAGLTAGMKSIYTMPHKWAFLAHSIFIWFTYLAMFYVTIFALPETANISFGAVVTAFVVGSIAIGFTNSGFGAYPILIAEILLLYNVPETAGLAFGWIVWISQTILMIALGGISFLLLPLFNRR
ncbi:lysylphosphatidylglycerol synthase transmembrane domain-containing protein [Flavobacterium sp.]|uniref:lysylphosphatidylglycerol synthase transmembrane domain-containing protein n=1 Tax=Flavobacterium sp. TaxID=239 RepID=UPI00260A217C|nr:lysylphosphatidylglycerol synthase transmembrane domain-containing protein [Flavobacterium sp.]